MTRDFNGWHITAILACGFGIVAAVNFLMAGLAVSQFGGVVVENSYVASQKFNSWLDEAERGEALGWHVGLERAGARLRARTEGVPAGAVVTALARRPIGDRRTIALTFASDGKNNFISREMLPDGRWTIRLTIKAEPESWVTEAALP